MLANRVRMGAGGKKADDIWGSPGGKILIAGDMNVGFFGEVSASEFISGDSLASMVGIQQGTSQHSDSGWLKYAYTNEIQFVAKKPIRTLVQWNTLSNANCIFGDRTIVVQGMRFSVRLLRGYDPKFPVDFPPPRTIPMTGETNHYSEWNKLIMQVHEDAIGKTWEYSENVENDISILRHNLGNGSEGMYNNSDLVTGEGNGGSHTWCMEMARLDTRVTRGALDVSWAGTNGPAVSRAWRPVLRLVI